jgi:phosphoacetylglucosamine mutase
MPVGFETVPPGSRCCSLDGDADRLIYYYFNQEHHELRLLDGDHIAALFADFILKHLNYNELTREFTFCVIQTAYANGNSTRYFKEKLVSHKPFLVSLPIPFSEMRSQVC